MTEPTPTAGIRPAGHRLFAALYDRVSAPLERAVLGEHRSALLGGIDGLVLDVGAGTGANLAYFRRVTRTARQAT